MTDKLIYIPNADTQNSLFCTLQLVVETLDTPLIEKVPKAAQSTNNKTLSKTLGTFVINNSLFPYCLH